MRYCFICLEFEMAQLEVVALHALSLGTDAYDVTCFRKRTQMKHILYNFG
jgi:hypothetical protein